MKKENILQTLSFLALKMENSGTALLEAIAPDSIAHLDYTFTRQNESTIFKEFGKAETGEIVEKLDYVAGFLKITNIQAVIMTVAFCNEFQDNNIDWNDIPKFFNVKSMVLLSLKKEFDCLVSSKYLRRIGNRRHSECYEIEQCVMESIMNRHPFDPGVLKEEGFDRYKFVKEISDLIEQRSDEEISTYALFDRSCELEQQNSTLSFVQNVQKLLHETKDRVLFYEICDDFLANGETGINCTLKDMYGNPSTRFQISRELMDEKHILMKLDLVSLLRDTMFSDSNLVLTEKGKQLFLEGDFELFAKSKNRDQKIICPEDIPEKSMFYDDELLRQLNLLKENLQEERFAELQKRLDEQSLPKGVAALFHGQPGTGKTETAMQIAKATGRAVCHVDISAAKTCWYGESQKLVKRIFTDYRQLCEKEKLKPILLFNEADALLSNRQNINSTSGSTSVAQTENAIQNIILEEMEKLDGILIATTNLIYNLDSAFERRFLFKIRFNNPTVEAKQSIWKSKLSWLSENESRTLAEQYNFSGGEIDNIVRKVIMEEVLSGIHPDMQFVEELCRYEKIGNKETSFIGFRK